MKKTIAFLLAAILLFSGVMSLPMLGEITPALSASAATGAKPATVRGLTCTAGTTKVKLNWKAAANANLYYVYQYSSTSGKFIKKAETSNRYYTVSGLTVGKTYKFAVRGVNKSGGKTVTGYKSEAVSVKTKYKPSAVKNLHASSIKTTTAALQWNALPNVKGYKIYLYNSSTKKYTYLNTVTGTTANIKSLKPGTTYKFAVRGYLVTKSGKTYNGTIAPAVTIKTKSVSESTLFYSYLRKLYKTASTAQFPKNAADNSLISAKIYDFDNDGKKEMAAFFVSSSSTYTSPVLKIRYYEIKNGAVKFINSLTDVCSLTGAGNWDISLCAYVKNRNIMIENSITSYGGSICLAQYIVLKVKNGKLKLDKDFRDTFHRGICGDVEAVSGKTYADYSAMGSAMKKAGFSVSHKNGYTYYGHTHKFTVSKLKDNHIFGFYANQYPFEVSPCVFYDNTKVRSHF